MLQAAVHAVCSIYSLPVLVFAFQIPLIFPLSLKHISYYGNWSVGTELGDIHTEGMLPGNLNINWMIIRQYCIWLRFCKNPQEPTEGEEVAAEVMMKETPNPATGMFCSPMTFPVTALWLRGRETRDGLCWTTGLWIPPRSSSLPGESHKVTAAFVVSFNDAYQRTVSKS